MMEYTAAFGASIYGGGTARASHIAAACSSAPGQGGDSSFDARCVCRSGRLVWPGLVRRAAASASSALRLLWLGMRGAASKPALTVHRARPHSLREDSVRARPRAVRACHASSSYRPKRAAAPMLSAAPQAGRAFVNDGRSGSPLRDRVAYQVAIQFKGPRLANMIRTLNWSSYNVLVIASSTCASTSRGPSDDRACHESNQRTAQDLSL